MTGNCALAVNAGALGIVAVTVTTFGAIVDTSGAWTCAAMFPAPSAWALPKASPPIDTTEPGCHWAPTTGTGAFVTKHAPWTASVAADAPPAAASAAVAAVAAAAAANLTLMSR